MSSPMVMTTLTLFARINAMGNLSTQDAQWFAPPSTAHARDKLLDRAFLANYINRTSRDMDNAVVGKSLVGFAVLSAGIFRGALVNWLEKRNLHRGQKHDIAKARLYPNESDAVTWTDLGNLGGGIVNGTNYNRRACYLNALNLNPQYGAAWANLGQEGGGTVHGTFYDGQTCYQQALIFNPEQAFVWYNLGIFGGGPVNGKLYNAKECYQKTLTLDPAVSFAWNNLGTSGGGVVQGSQHSEKDCYQRALSLEPNNGHAWCNLGNCLGGTMHGQKYTQAECLQRFQDLQGRGKDVLNTAVTHELYT